MYHFQMDWIYRAKQQMSVMEISQDDLANAMNCSRSAVGHYLAGRRKPPVEQLVQIADYLGVSRSWLLFGEVAQSVNEPQASYQTHLGTPIHGTNQTGIIEDTLGYLPNISAQTGSYVIKVIDKQLQPHAERGEYILLQPLPADIDNCPVLIQQENGTCLVLQLVSKDTEYHYLHKFNQPVDQLQIANSAIKHIAHWTGVIRIPGEQLEKL